MSERKIQRIAITGTGQMGSGIGMEFARYGYQVALHDAFAAALPKAMENIQADLDLMIETELITKLEAKDTLSRIRTTTDLTDAAANADHVVEAVPENLALKQQVFAQLDEICAPDVVLATNSSSMKAEDCSAKTKHPERVLITHYWHPAPFVPLVEVIGSRKTAPQYLERTASLLRTLHKRVVVQKLENLKGAAGWGNAIQHPFEEILKKFVDDGVEPQIVDDLVKYGFGRRLPFAPVFMRYDIIGLDFFYNAAKVRGNEAWKPIKERVERGEKGMKSGKGFYDWPGDAAKQFIKDYNRELIRLMKHDMARGDI